jgi:hypothetical protein
VRKILSTLLGFAMLAVLVVAAWLAVQWVIGILQTGGKPADVVNGMLLAAMAAVTYLWQSGREQRQQLEARLASAKRERYEAYVDALKDFMASTRQGKQPDVAAYLSKLEVLAFHSILVASDPVVMAHIRLTNLERVSPGDPTVLMAAIGDLLVALRKDMGFADTKLTNQQILGVFVKDMDANPEPFTKWARLRAAWDQKMGWTNKWRSGSR